MSFQYLISLYLCAHIVIIPYDGRFVSGTMKYESLPTALDECFQRLYDDNEYVQDSAEIMATTCLSEYTWKNVAVRCYNMSQNSLDYIGSMLLPYYHEEGRHKRTTPRVRKEYRSLTVAERERFHTALNQLKNDTSVFPNAYDVIARFHNFEVAGAAHGGSAFLPWHRIYMMIMENALRSKQPDVTIPYWDITLDGNMESGNSIMWTKEFMGSIGIIGRVQDGPVESWRLRRFVGHGGGLLIGEERLSDLLDIQNSTEFARLLERYHNAAHGWVGGDMSGLETAPFDPMFFMLHCYIDYVWWQWQTNNREESFTWEYPLDDEGPHGADEPVLNLQINGTNITNGDAFNQTWAFEYVTYEPRPSCSPDMLTCIGPNMQCETVSNATVCVSATSSPTVNCRRRREISDTERLANLVNSKPGEKHRLKTKRAIHQDSSQLKKDHRETSTSDINELESTVDVQILEPVSPLMTKTKIPQVKDYVHDNKVKEIMSKHNHMEGGRGFSIQNSFEINCEADSRLWVYMPFKVIHLRPHGKIYSSRLVTKGRITDRQDMYSGQMYRSTKTCIKPETPVANEKCKSDDSGFFRVIVSSYGLNYHGVYKDYVILDNRQAVDGKTGYIAFKRPDKKSSKFILMAFDECGRICTPKCRVPGSGPPRYKPCSGVLDIDSKKPRRYSDTYGEAVLRYWNLKDGACPSAQESNIDIVFYCEYKNDWFPWQ